jgi:hypothetical protein
VSRGKGGEDVTIATPPATIGIIGGRPAIIIEAADGRDHAYQFSLERDGNLVRVQLDKLDGTGAAYVVTVTPRGASCTCPAARYGRLQKSPDGSGNKRVFLPCKHIISVRVLLDVLAGIGG